MGTNRNALKGAKMNKRLLFFSFILFIAVTVWLGLMNYKRYGEINWTENISLAFFVAIFFVMFHFPRKNTKSPEK
jgi:cbb3-type cytochrome oxidase subunit 1